MKKGITLLDEPDAMLDSQYGHISYEEWCENEVARICENGGQAVLGRCAGKVCVARS